MRDYRSAVGAIHFPRDTTLVSEGGVERLAIGGVALSVLAEEYGTPLYVLSGSQLAHSADQWRTHTTRVRPGTTVHFASKSLPVLAVLRALRERGLGVDVSTEGEARAALRAGFTGEHMLVHGNAKSMAELRLGLEVGVRFFVVDNHDDIERLARMATPAAPARVVIRVVPEVAPATVAGMATAHVGQKFGIELGQLAAARAAIARHASLEFLGYHAHVGSQITRLEPFLEAVDRLVALDPPRVLDIGGGLGTAYLADQPVPSVEQFCDVVLGELNSLVTPDCEVVVEPGRSIAARALVTLYEVQTVKRGSHNTFVGLDGGTSDNLEVVMDYHPQDALVLDCTAATSEPISAEICTVVGKHCDSGDVLIGSVELAPPAPGDLVVLPTTGAYSHAMASNYNAVPRPAMVWVEAGASRVIVRRETIDDVFARDLLD